MWNFQFEVLRTSRAHNNKSSILCIYMKTNQVKGHFAHCATWPTWNSRKTLNLLRSSVLKWHWGAYAKTTATAAKTSLENKQFGNGDYFQIIASSSHPVLLIEHAANGQVEAPVKLILRKKDLLLRVHVVVKTLNLEISRCHLADYVKQWSNRIIVFWCRRCRCRRLCVSSPIGSFSNDDGNGKKNVPWK